MNKLFVSILTAVLFILLSGCLVKSSQSSPEAPCSIETLLISDTFLPKDIFYETGSRSSYDPPAKIGVEKIGTSFSSESMGGLIHDIYRFNTENEAQNEVEQIITYEFENDAQWFSPPITPQISADEYKFSCTQLSAQGVRCRLVAQYRVYVSDLNVDLIAINYSDLESIIEHLDNRLVSCIKP